MLLGPLVDACGRACGGLKKFISRDRAYKSGPQITKKAVASVGVCVQCGVAVPPLYIVYIVSEIRIFVTKLDGISLCS